MKSSEKEWKQLGTTFSRSVVALELPSVNSFKNRRRPRKLEGAFMLF